MRALIVEPSRMIRNIFVSLFSKNGIQAVGVETAAEALGQLAGEPVDFLCFAMQLSDMTGLEFYAAAKERGLIGKHPSVMLTGSQETVGAAALGLGVTECFSKSEPAVFEGVRHPLGRPQHRETARQRPADRGTAPCRPATWKSCSTPRA